ncbi:hypothetical protein ED733_003427 [Metarhizium rileyi]|uniref:Mid2 domain-containing protein n=1 Tax=Metarhizium rileyi (strain RCEF 4871) TaxID=1649241 RepID=A0A5C6G842_METRR|nr:hypothetical protein ED733_003427 [Metarhizium rileyi]
MISNHFFTQLPPPTAALLVLSTLSSSVAGHVLLPRETNAVQERTLNIVPWPLATSAPMSPFESLRRRSDTICGYIGGDPDLPATCLAGSHCAVDVEHGVIGCCPDKGPCNDGIFTGCVDRNSGPQTVANPYIYTCRGKNVCYKNIFEGGYFQYGCGSASGLATTVVQTASGRTPLHLTTISIKLTATITPLSNPTTLSSELSKTSDYSMALESSLASNGPPRPSQTGGGAAPSSHGSDRKNTGAVIGGAIGGVAFVFAIGILAFSLWRRKTTNEFIAAANTYTRTMTPASHHDFVPLPSSHDASEARLHADNGTSVQSGLLRGNTESGRTGGPALHQQQQQQQQQQRQHSHEAMGTAMSRNGHPNYDSDRVPLTRELDNFSHGSNSALEGIETDSDVEANPTHPANYRRSRRGAGSSVLWQQNRRQNRRRSRNLAWM